MSDSDKRDFIRMSFEKPFEFKVCSINLISELHLASSRNVSQTGMCFSTNSNPPIGTILKIKVDLETLAKCIRVEHMLFELNDSILGKVMWVRASSVEVGINDVGVAFIKTGEAETSDVKEAVQLAN